MAGDRGTHPHRPDAELLAQVAGNPADGLATLVDAVPGLLAADVSVAAVVPVDWASRGPARAAARRSGTRAGGPRSSPLPEITPLLARAVTTHERDHFAIAPFGRAGLVLVVTRERSDTLAAPAFTSTEWTGSRTGRAQRGDLGDRLEPGRGPTGGHLSDPFSPLTAAV